MCNNSSSPLADIILFVLSSFGLPLKVFKTRMLGRGFHALIKNVSFPSRLEMWDLTIFVYFGNLCLNSLVCFRWNFFELNQTINAGTKGKKPQTKPV